MILLAAILLITGSYVRTRTLEESDTADWLVLVQLGMCVAGAFVGCSLIRKHSLGGPGGRRLIAFCLAVITSGLFSSYFKLVAGYWVLLVGTGLLCIGLVSSSGTEPSLRRVEALILVTLSLMIVKDTILSLFILEPIEAQDVFRLGEGVTNANLLGLTAALAFCMSLGMPAKSNAARISWFALRGLFAAVILLSRSRIALIAVVVGFVIRLWFSKRNSLRTRSYALGAIPCCIGSLVVLASLTWTMELQPVTALVDFVNRGEGAGEVISLTGRMEIWPYAVQRVFDGTTSLIFGHGYGASKEVLNESNWRASFLAYHSHNTVLELLVATGLLGTLPFLLLVSYSLKWLTRFVELCKSFSVVLALRAIAVIAAILSSTVTESDLATKIGPLMIVFMFYVLALDRQAVFTVESAGEIHAE
ncbi:MAG TPA: O-antigen ligase family protein [Terriglobia bacterium]|nr:O-antigen ligase family protein [Terriglobia bacterium]